MTQKDSLTVNNLERRAVPFQLSLSFGFRLRPVKQQTSLYTAALPGGHPAIEHVRCATCMYHVCVRRLQRMRWCPA